MTIKITDKMVSDAEVAALVEMLRLGLPCDFQEVLCQGDARATVPPLVLRTAIRSALEAAVPHVAGWQPIETAPHGEVVLLGWWSQDGFGGVNWECETGCASHGWRCGSISNTSYHGQATHWMPLPPPAQGGE